MLPETFWSRVQKTKTCWLWTGTKNEQGYGLVKGSLRVTPRRAHRYLWAWVNGPIPEGVVIRHRCDTPACVRPDHLEAGTPRENTHDMLQRGRARNGSALTPEAVRAIRAMAEDRPQREVAEHFSLSRAAVCNIVNRKTWAQVT